MDNDTENFYNGVGGSITIREPFVNNLTFTGYTDEHQPTTLLTITQDGRMILGAGLSAEEATQQVAKMLVEHYAVELDLKYQGIQKDLDEALKKGRENAEYWKDRADKAEAELKRREL